MLAGCAGEREPAPRLPTALAERLAERGDSVAALLEGDDPCGTRSEAQRLQAEAIDAVNARRIPSALQEELLGAATELVESIECPSSSLSPTRATEARSLSSWLREKS